MGGSDSFEPSSFDSGSDAGLAGIFGRAKRLPPAERAAFLDRVCAGDGALRAEVESLLAAAEQNAGFFGRVGEAGDPPTLEDAPIAGLAAGVQLGPFVLLEEIDRGGHGVVWAAEEREPVQRRVAIKVLKPGMDSSAMIARFAAERSTLAQMEHPNIARLISAGATPRGLPFVAMEFVEGVSITRFCDGERLSVRARLELLLEVCDAIEHAHRRFVIHRDLKPSNVLVHRDDSGRARIRVIDFGVAKLLQEPITDASVHRMRGSIIGTPGYMAPEQVADAPDIDIRVDVYSLGVMLYELLVGSKPIEAKSGDAEGLEELLARVRETDPVRPSLRVAELPIDRRATTAANRSTSPSRLETALRGDLDWIALKALERERDRRYGTVQEFADDLRRHLRHEPVRASPPSRVYQIRKFVRRHRSASVAGVAVALAGIATITGLSMAVVMAERARAAESRRAEEVDSLNSIVRGVVKDLPRAEAGAALIELILRRAEQHARAVGRSSAEVEREVAALRDALQRVGGTSMADAVIGAVVLDQLAAGADHLEQGQPENAARILETLATAYSDRGEIEASLESQRRAHALYAQTLGPDDRETLRSLGDIARSERKLGRSEQAAEILVDLVERGRRALPPDDADCLRWMIELGRVRTNLGRFEAAEALIQETIDAAMRQFGAEALLTLEALAGLADLRSAENRHAEAMEIWDRVLAALRDKHPDNLIALREIASDAPPALARVGRAVEAEALASELVAFARESLGDAHTATLGLISNRSALLSSLGRHDEAISTLRECLERTATESSTRTSRVILHSQLAAALQRAGQLVEAEAVHRTTYDLAREAYGDAHDETVDYLINIGSCLRAQKRHADASPIFREAYERRMRDLPLGHPSQTTAIVAYADQLRAELKEAERLALLRGLVDRHRDGLPKSDPSLLTLRVELATSLVRSFKFDECIQTLEELVEIYRQERPHDLAGLQRATELLGLGYIVATRGEAAYARMQEASDLMIRMYGPSHPRRAALDASLEQARQMAAMKREASVSASGG